MTERYKLLNETTKKTVEHVQQCCENLYDAKEYATEENKGEIVAIRLQLAQYRLAYLSINETNMVGTSAVIQIQWSPCMRCLNGCSMTRCS